MSLKIAFITSLERGGPVEHTLVLAGRLAGQGVGVKAVCATDELAARFDDAGADTAVLPIRRPLDPLQASRIWRFAAGCHVIHAQDRRSALWMRVGPRPARGALRVYSVHGLPDDYLPTPVGRARPRLRAALGHRALDAFLCRRADAIIVASRALGRLLVARLGFPAAEIHVIPNGVELPPSLQGGGSLVGSVSLLEPVKGLDVFLRAAARLADERPSLRFAIYGTGRDAVRLSALARALGIADRLEQPGHVPVEEALTKLGIFVLSSYMENCPMALLEAMAAGVPVVATDVGGVSEIVSSASAQLVESGDDAGLARAVGRLMDDPASAQAQAVAARQRIAERFTAEANAAETLSLYERLLAARR